MNAGTKEPDLMVFSAGAVAQPLEKAVRSFEQRNGVICDTIVGKPGNHLATISTSKVGDIISCGAEYILDEADDRGWTVRGSRRSVGTRRSVIIVPTGNPAGIRSIEDLCKKGVRIGIATDGCLKGVWDDVCSKAGLVEAARENITHHADACGSLMALINLGKVDAVFGWNAFKNIWPTTCEAVELPRDIQVFRSTVVSVVSYTKNRPLSEKLIEFLTSDEGRKVYSEYGWIHRV